MVTISLLALEDLRLQQQMFSALEALSPKIELFQQLRAATRYDQQFDPEVVEAFVEREADFQRVNTKVAQANNGANSAEAGREIDVATTLSVN